MTCWCCCFFLPYDTTRYLYNRKYASDKDWTDMKTFKETDVVMFVCIYF